MKDFIDDFVLSLTSRRQERVYDLLAAAKVQKADLQVLADKINGLKRQSPIVIDDEIPGSSISGNKFDLIFRDIYNRIVELYQVSNLISLLLDSNTSVLTAEIKGIEDELISMEKLINNYAFSLSDGGSFDYIFTETFSDETMMETFEFPLPDRVGGTFDDDELAVVNSASGILTLSPALNFNYTIAGDVVSSNCLGFKTSDTGLANATNANVNTGWRVAISSPRSINSSVVPGYKAGAQVLLEFFLDDPSPSDMIILTPFADMPIEILSIKIFDTTTDTGGVEIVTNPTVVDRPFNFTFPLQSVAKFSLLINQSTYTRSTMTQDPHESQYRFLSGMISDNRRAFKETLGHEYKRNKKAFKYVFLRTEKPSNRFPGFFKSAVPQVDFDVACGPLTLDKMLHNPEMTGGAQAMWRKPDKTQTLMRRLIYERFFPNNFNLLNERVVLSRRSDYTFNEVPRMMAAASSVPSETVNSPFVEPPLDPFVIADADESSQINLNYEYNMGFRNIQIGSGLSVYNGVYVSKSLPAPSDSGEVRMRVQDTNFKIVGTSRHQPQVTSVEYSVTNRSTPRLETDWLPILPVNTPRVLAERFFMNEMGLGYFRFPAALDGNITLYRNGYFFEYNTDAAYVYSNSRQSVIGLQLPLGVFSANDIFTTDYLPAADASTVNFDNAGFGQSLLASAFDENGAGQTFNGTTQDRSVQLAFEPYVDYLKINEVGSYTPLGFEGTYQPITIIMADGTVALNQTNYLGTVQNNLGDLATSASVFYIHSGSNIIFNKVVDQRFTIFYQYLPSNLRFRVVLRVNDLNFVTPVVDSVQVKTKIRKPDRRKTF